MVIRTQTMSDGNKAKLIYNNNGEAIEQKITKVCNEVLWVKSSKGKEYKVNMSDKVKMTMEVHVGDTAVIKTFKNGWLVFDVIPAPADELTEFDILYRKKINGKITADELERFKWLQEHDMELQQQLKDFDDLLGGY